MQKVFQLLAHSLLLAASAQQQARFRQATQIYGDKYIAALLCDRTALAPIPSTK